MLHRLLLSLMTASALVLGGCALSPQQLDPQPVLKGPLTAVGHGQPVVVKVVDGLPARPWALAAASTPIPAP